jgi:hypothetical protein
LYLTTSPERCVQPVCISCWRPKPSIHPESFLKTPRMSALPPLKPSLPLDPALRSSAGFQSLHRPILPYPERQLQRTASMESSHDVERQKKRPRTNVTIACDRCKLARAKCSGDKPCSSCSKRALPCAYDLGNDRRQNRGSYEEVQALTVRLTNYQRLISTLQSTSTGHAYYILQCLREVTTEGDTYPPADPVQPATASATARANSPVGDSSSTSVPFTSYEDTSPLIDWIRNDLNATSGALDPPFSQPVLRSLPSTLSSTLSSLDDEPSSSPAEPRMRRNSSLTVAGLLC